jgi:DNA helicase-2/ATP-dependent DNA helicase PcrA
MTTQRVPSRFLIELPPEVLRWERTADAATRWDGGRAGVGARGEVRRNPNFVGGTPKASELASRLGIDGSRLTTASELSGTVVEVAPGDRVNHQRYGVGRVKAVEGGQAQVDFGEQVVWVRLRNAPIEKL